MRSRLIRVVAPLAQSSNSARSHTAFLAPRLSIVTLPSASPLPWLLSARSAHSATSAAAPAASSSPPFIAAPPVSSDSSSSSNPDSPSSDHTAALTTPPPAPIFLTTRDSISGRRITTDLGLVAASAFRSRNLIIDLLVAVTRIFGGETPDYTLLLNECTIKASQRLEATARAAGATSVVGVRFVTTSTMNRVIVGLHVSVLASGTAVIDVPADESTHGAAHTATRLTTAGSHSHGGSKQAGIAH